MSRPTKRATFLDAQWAHHHADLRDPQEVVSQWASASEVDPRLLRYAVRGRFWDALEAASGTLIVTREKASAAGRDFWAVPSEAVKKLITLAGLTDFIPMRPGNSGDTRAALRFGLGSVSGSSLVSSPSKS